MWSLEFSYMLENEEALFELCQRAKENDEKLVWSNYGHLVLQHALLFTQKSLSKSNGLKRTVWYDLRSGLLETAVQALAKKSKWESESTSASHFIHLCIDLIRLDVEERDESLKIYRSQILRTVLDDDELLAWICEHTTGQYTARRIYELGTREEKKKLAQSARTHTNLKIAKLEIRDLEKFKLSLLEDKDLDLPLALGSDSRYM